MIVNMSNTRVLIGTLYCGENEFQAHKRSIEWQTFSNWEHIVFENLPNKVAHDRLYRTFTERSSEYDIFVKLDADMVFSRKSSLSELVSLFQSEPDLDHAILAVHDWASDSLILGLHVFSNRVYWERSAEQLFVDHSPNVPGKRLVTYSAPAPVADHGPDPSPFQGFHFGVHRALKVVQNDRSDFRLFRSRMQWKLLTNVWMRFVNTQDRRLGLIIQGADCVVQGGVARREYDYTNTSLLERFEATYAALSPEELYERLEARWNSCVQRERIYMNAVGFYRMLGAACVEIPKRAMIAVYKKASSKYVSP